MIVPRQSQSGSRCGGCSFQDAMCSGCFFCSFALCCVVLCRACSVMPFCGTKWKRNEAFERRPTCNCVLCEDGMGHGHYTSNLIRLPHATSRAGPLAFLPEVTYAHNDRGVWQDCIAGLGYG